MPQLRRFFNQRPQGANWRSSGINWA